MISVPSSRRVLRPAAAVLAAGAALAVVPSSTLAADVPPSGATSAGDFNGDGHLDYVVGPPAGTRLQPNVIAFGSAGRGEIKLPGDGGVGVVLDYSATREWQVEQALPVPIRVGDVDGDGYDDVLQPGWYKESWLIYGGPQQGTLAVASGTPRVTTLLHEYIVPQQQNVGIGDFNGDGFDDWLQSRTVKQARSTGALEQTGGGVVVLGGPRVAQLDTRGQGDRRIQINTNAKQQCGIAAIFFPVVLCNYWWSLPGLVPVGDHDRDGKADLYQSAGSFVIRGRSDTAPFHAQRRDANGYVVSGKPAGDPWGDPSTPEPDPADPTATGMAGWTLAGFGQWVTKDEAVSLTARPTISGAAYDTSKRIDANEIVVDFDLQMSPQGTATPGNGATLAFSAPLERGTPQAYGTGIGLGWVGNKGMAIAFGTVKGTYTPSNNYVGLVNGVVGRSGYPTFVQSAPAVSKLAGATNHITFRASGGVVSVSINGVERLRRTQQMPTQAYLGFTAGTSTATQDHIIRNVKISKP